MSLEYYDDHKDVDSEEAVEHRKNFLSRMERKLEFKLSASNSGSSDDGSLARA